ncbi:MAG: hypothetical protein GWN76_07625, partial [candidate division Zixibacteria bacterium]|nr:hypothetical protein [candidate division Zixibacteria bacterium]
MLKIMHPPYFCYNHLDMTEDNYSKENDLVLLAGPRGKNLLINLQPGEKLQTHVGEIEHNDLIGKVWGTRIFTHLGKFFYLLQPNLNDTLLNLKRSGTILYPKDIGYILMNLDISPGKRVIEAGTGSGGLTVVLAKMVGASGHVYSYEVRPEVQRLAEKNIRKLGLE